MPLSLLCGPFQPALEDAFTEHLARQPPGPGRRVTVVTASQRMAERLQRLIAQERGAAYLNIRFATFHGLALDILRAAGGDLPTIVNDELFHEKLVEGLLRAEGAFPPERARALAGAHRATLRDLVEAGLDTAAFREHFADLEIPAEGKLQRLLDLADRYRDRLAELNIATSADLARRAARCVEEQPALLEDTAEFLYYGFYDLNGAQADFFAAVAKTAAVTVFFPSVKDHPGWVFAERFLDLKLRVGGAEARRLSADVPGPARNVLPRLFDPGPPAPGGAPDARVISVSGERDAVWRVAKEILSLRSADPFLSWGRIGVVARTTEPVCALVSEIFNDNAIPFSLSDGGPWLGHPAIRLALDLLRLPDRPDPRDALLDILSSPCFSSTFFTAVEKDAVRDYLRRSSPRAGRPVLAPPGVGPADDDFPADLGPAPRPDALRRLEDLWAVGPDSWTWSEWTGWARQRVDAHLASDAALEPARDALREIGERLSRLDRISPPVGLRDFLDAFAGALARERRPGPSIADGVRVRGVMDARGESFDVLFLIGLNEGGFPRSVREDPLLGDETRRLLRDPGGYWILPKMEGYDEEKLLFTAALASARSRLYLVYARSTEDGRTGSPSLYLREFLRAAGRGFEDVERLPRSPLEKWNAVPSSALTPLEAGLADVLEKRRPPREWAPVLLAGARALGTAASAAFHGDVQPPTAYLDRLRARGLSPSALETYALCPFKFFLAKVLGINVPRPAFDGESVDPRFLGRARHEILCRVYGVFLGQDRPEPETVVARMREETARVFSFMADPGGPHPRLWSALSARTALELEAFVRRDLARLAAEGFRPDRLEWTLPPTPLEGIPWAGRLDRVDWNPRERTYRVVDYKTKIGATSLRKSVAEGWAHQIPVYMDLVDALAPWGPGARGGGARLEALSENETDEMTGESWVELSERVRAQRRRQVALLAAGRFPVRAGDERHCRFCDFARACRKAHPASRARGDRDARADETLPAPAAVTL
ncbi:MAG: exodeoxyribonuclease V subunit gamma [Elusimicrobia bacterium]|nr:exodeoxyribonuclease V subunit gamma [Elusimicrobiota bacterium]MBP8004547.1 exodeoxyribonuclease V subunit gamma [Elusimicrobiota bacterium]